MGEGFTLAQSRNQLCWGALPIPGHRAAETRCVQNQHVDQNKRDNQKNRFLVLGYLLQMLLYVRVLNWRQYHPCSLMDQVLSKAGLLCAEESTPSVVSSCHKRHTHTHTRTHTCTSAQTLKLGTISIVTQHYRFDYHCVIAGIAYCTTHQLGEAPFITISSFISTHWKKNYNHMLHNGM